MSADLVREHALRDTDFRIIGRIPLADALGGLSGFPLPHGAQDLTQWSDFPKAGDVPAPDTPDDPSNPDLPKPSHIIVETEPLDLGLPETDKRLRALTARGIFARQTHSKPDTEGVTMILYGSHHRERWRRIATVRGPHLRLLRGVRYRWLKVSLTAPFPAIFEALTFLITP